MPILDDEMATGFGLGKLTELKNNIKKSLFEQKQKEAQQSAEREMLEKIAAKTKFGHIPEMLVENETKTMLAELEQTITGQGGNFTDYLQSINKTTDQLTLDLLPEAVKRVQVSLLIREIANMEKISVPEPDVDKHIQEMKKHYQNNQEIMQRLNMAEYKNYVWNVLASRKVIDKLREWNIK
jgi:FKBP-type peptidyl-prolyl cis-trans isomerase (trigger factor)